MTKLFQQIDQLNPMWILPFAIVAFLMVLGICYLIAAWDVRREMKAYLKEGSTKVFRKEFIVIITCLFLFSCSAPKHYQAINGLKMSGTYTVKSYKGSTATFQEFPGQYVVPSDTLKKGDKIFITIVRPVKINKNAKDSKSTVQKTQTN